jgi:hypothetical protein
LLLILWRQKTAAYNFLVDWERPAITRPIRIHTNQPLRKDRFLTERLWLWASCSFRLSPTLCWRKMTKKKQIGDPSTCRSRPQEQSEFLQSHRLGMIIPRCPMVRWSGTPSLTRSGSDSVVRRHWSLFPKWTPRAVGSVMGACFLRIGRLTDPDSPSCVGEDTTAPARGTAAVFGHDCHSTNEHRGRIAPQRSMTYTCPHLTLAVNRPMQRGRPPGRNSTPIPASIY